MEKMKNAKKENRRKKPHMSQQGQNAWHCQSLTTGFFFTRGKEKRGTAMQLGRGRPYQCFSGPKERKHGPCATRPAFR